MTKLSLLPVLQFLLCTGGIYASYLTQGIIQETLSTEAFGPDRQHFKNLSILSMVQGLGCLAVSWTLLHLFPDRKHWKDYPSLMDYCPVGVTTTLGPSFGYASLSNINYSAQVIIKSCKLIPTMLMGVVLYKVHYSFSEWTVVGILCSGLTLFSLQSSPKAISKLSSPNLFLGYTLCLLNLMCDGYTNSKQDNINKNKHNSVIYMMFTTNFWLSLYSTVLFLVAEAIGMQSACSEFLHFFWSDGLFKLYIIVEQLGSYSFSGWSNPMAAS